MGKLVVLVMYPNKKRSFNIALVLTAFLSFLVMLPAAYASILPPIITDNLSKFFSIKGFDTANVWLFKFAFFIVAFAILYMAAVKVFMQPPKTGGVPTPKNIPVAISLTISLASAILIPANLARTIFNSYAWLVAVLMLLGPAIGFLWYGGKLKKDDATQTTRFTHGIRAFAFAIASYYFGAIGTLEMFNGIDFLGGSKDIIRLSEIAVFASAVFLILAIIEAVKSFGIKGGPKLSLGGDNNGDPTKKPETTGDKTQPPGKDQPQGDGDKDRYIRFDRDGNPVDAQIELTDAAGHPIRGARLEIAPAERG
ncbi:MAG: hypothetical protein V1659_04215 [Candidatus Woesearchaeota archaeon]